MDGSKWHKNWHKRWVRRYRRVASRFGQVYRPRRLRREWANAQDKD